MQHFRLEAGDLRWSVGPLHACRDQESRFVLDLVSRDQAVPVRLLLHPSRCRARAARARQIAMYLMNVMLGRNMAAVGEVFRRDRSTISYACARIEDLREDPEFDARLARCEAVIETFLEGGAGGRTDG